MKRVKAVFPIFLLFLLISGIILFFAQTPLTAGLQLITLPIQKIVFGMNFQPTNSPTSEQLQQENTQLRTQLAQMQEMQQDNQALHDQFKTTTPPPQKLLPADIVGMQQNALIIDKGAQDSVHVGDVVVYKNNLIGSVTKTTPTVSLVTLLSDPSTSFTAITAKTAANGIVKSEDGGSIVFGNVVLTDKLESNDIVETKGSMTVDGKGYPSQLIVGKIVSIDKQASSLFQSAKLQSLVNVSQLRMVFVMN